LKSSIFPTWKYKSSPGEPLPLPSYQYVTDGTLKKIILKIRYSSPRIMVLGSMNCGS
jgi:hypothetical protein